MHVIGMLLVAMGLGGCGGRAPTPRAETAALLPEDCQGIYLGMERKEVERRFPVHGTHLTDDGLETVTRLLNDSVQIGLAFAYRDNGLATATIWYDYSLIPRRVDQKRREFLTFLMEHVGTDYQPCSFEIPGTPLAPDLGLCWPRAGFQVVATFSKPSTDAPDTLGSRPYVQVSLFDSLTAPMDIWPNIVIPAADAERPFFHEVDSLLEAVRQRRRSAP